jgi:hypothetical protein
MALSMLSKAPENTANAPCQKKPARFHLSRQRHLKYTQCPIKEVTTYSDRAFHSVQHMLPFIAIPFGRILP